jgi:hypothetical protein
MHAVTNVDADGVYFRDGASSKVLAGDTVKLSSLLAGDACFIFSSIL